MRCQHGEQVAVNNQEAHLNAVFSGHKLRESAYPRLVMRNQASFLAPSKRNAPPHCVTESMRLPLVILAFTCLLSQLPAEENWPQFRGPRGAGCSDTAELPVRWSETENVRWKTLIHGKGWSSPVIWGDQIWVTTATPDGHELFAVCVERASGKIVHDIRVFEILKPSYCHPFNSYASPTPTIEAGRVYVHFGSAGTACLDTGSGKVLWARQDMACDHYRGPGSSAVLHEDLLIIHFDGIDQQYVVALDKLTGKTVWKRTRDIRWGSLWPVAA